MSAPVELVPDRLYLLGDTVELDGRISWVPSHVRGWTPVNCYALVQAGSVLVVDPGPAVLAGRVADQLATLVAPGTPVSVLLTRAEPDCAGGLGELDRRFGVRVLYAGGGPNPFDGFTAAADAVSRSSGSGSPASGLVGSGSSGSRERIQLERMPDGYPVEVAPGRPVRILTPAVRLLATWWAHDQATGTLFTSDSFGHTVLARSDDPRRVSGPDAPAVADVADHLTSKFGWLAHARTPALRKDTRALLDGLDVRRIAPGHGCVIEGEDAVRAHVDALDAALEQLAG